MYPDFLVIGAQKAGTTWLYENLRRHPGIWMPPEKELHYFDEKQYFDASLRDKLRGDREIDLRWRRQVSRRLRGYRGGLLRGKYPPKDLLWDARYFLRPTTDEWYASLFEPGRGRVTGETTPTYSMLGPEAVSRIYDLMPRAKIIFMMRNPVERAWSQAMMGLGGKRPVGEVPDERLRWFFNRRRSRRLSNYLRTLKVWGDVFPKEQIFVGFLEDIHFYPNRLLRRLYRFLGVDVSADYRVIRRKVHAGQADKVPAHLAAELAELYRDQLGRLAGQFGGYADFWLHCAGRLAESAPENGPVAYPFWESPMWQDWIGADGEPFDPRRQNVFQSGVLPAVLARANGEN